MKKYFSGAMLSVFLSGGGAALADPAFGFGLTYVFGGDWAVGVRVFHDDEPESAVLALGFDYKFGTQAFRPTVGAAYLDEDFYIDLSLGYDTRLQALDYGIGVGAAFETQQPAASGGGATTTGADTASTGGGNTDTADTGGGTTSDGGGDTSTDTGDGGTDTGSTDGGGTGDGGTGDGGTGDGGAGDGGADDGGTDAI